MQIRCKFYDWFKHTFLAFFSSKVFKISLFTSCASFDSTFNLTTYATEIVHWLLSNNFD